MERLAQITVIRKEANEWGDLQPGQMTPVEGSDTPNLWMICCPLCSNLGELRTHQVTENKDGTVTVSPSLVCHGSIYRAPSTYEPCTAHYFVERNQIRWC
jgi:hypothetical protein